MESTRKKKCGSNSFDHKQKENEKANWKPANACPIK
jgi:hypothetical protein